MQNIENTGGFSRQFTSSTPGTSLTSLLEVNPIHAPYYPLESNHFVSYSFQLESFDLAVHLPSKAIAPVPPISPEDTAAEKALKVRKIELAFPKIGLELHLDHGFGYSRRALIVLQNRGAEWYMSALYPFLGTNEVLLMGKESKLAIRFVPLETNGESHGTIQFNDYVHCSGTWKQTILIVPKTIEILANTRNLGVDVAADSIAFIAPYRPSRGLVWIQNSGPNRVYLSFHSDPAQLVPGASIYLDPGATSAYESSKYNLPQPIYAKSIGGPSRLEGMEAY